MVPHTSLAVAAAVVSVFGLTTAQADTISVTNNGVNTVSVSAQSADGATVLPFFGTKLTNTNYFVAEPYDPVDIAFTLLQTSFNLLWGSVDTYNDLILEFCLKGSCNGRH